MNDLKKLCLEGNNLILVNGLYDAMVETRVSLVYEMWQEIKCNLEAKIPDLPELSEESDISPDRVRRFVMGQRNSEHHGLYSKLDSAHRAFLGVER